MPIDTWGRNPEASDGGFTAAEAIRFVNHLPAPANHLSAASSPHHLPQRVPR
jgi:hypothetical protein